MKTKKLTLPEYTAQVNQILTDEYASTLESLMLDENEEMTKAMANKETPREWVDWFAGKYGLTKSANFTPSMAARVMSSLGVDFDVKCGTIKARKK